MWGSAKCAGIFRFVVPAARYSFRIQTPTRALSQGPQIRASKSKGKVESSASTAAAGKPFVDDAGDIEADFEQSSDVKAQMAKHVEWAKRELSKLRGASANPSVLDHVVVEAYGERQPLPAIAQVSLKNASTVVVSPFDTALVATIADSIRDAGLNLNPSVDGNFVRIPIPKPSKETRDATLRLAAKIAEAARSRIRRVRQAAMDKIKRVDGVSPDDTFRDMKDVQALTAAATDEIGKLADKKKAEIEAA